MNRQYGTWVLIVLMGIAAGVGVVYVLQTRMQGERQIMEDKLLVLQQQIAEINKRLEKLTGESAANSLTLEEVNRRQNIQTGASGDADLTQVVSRVTPSVVSIVVSKDVPKLEVVYVNPFGNDPFFKDFGVQVPVYRQKGTELQKVGAGSGFIVTAEGYIVTNRHVVADTAATYTVLLSNGAQRPARVLYRSPDQDVALVKIEGTYTPLSFGNSAQLQLGQSVVAIGNALGEFSNTVSVGIISGLNRTIEAADERGRVERLSGIIQTDAAINPGNSGGPLINLRGEVVGVNVATVSGASSISFAVPSDIVKQVLQTVLR